MRSIVLLVLLLLFPGLASAQVGADKCGSWPGAETRLEELAEYFTSDEQADFREAVKISQLPLHVERRLITDRKECTKVINAALKVLRKSPGWREMRRLGFQHNIFRYGPYYAVAILQQVPEGHVRVGGYALMLIFRAEDLAYLGAGLV